MGRAPRAHVRLRERNKNESSPSPFPGGGLMHHFLGGGVSMWVECFLLCWRQGAGGLPISITCLPSCLYALCQTAYALPFMPKLPVETDGGHGCGKMPPSKKHSFLLLCKTCLCWGQGGLSMAGNDSMLGEGGLRQAEDSLPLPLIIKLSNFIIAECF